MIETFISEWKQKTWSDLDQQRSNDSTSFQVLPNEICGAI